MKMYLTLGLALCALVPTTSANSIFGTYDKKDVNISQYASGGFEIRAKDKSFKIEYYASGGFEIELEKNRKDYQDLEYNASKGYELNLEHEGKQKVHANWEPYKNTTVYNYLNASDIAQIERDIKAMLTANPIVVKDLKSYLTSASGTIAPPTRPGVNDDKLGKVAGQKKMLTEKWETLEKTLAQLDTKKREQILKNFLARIEKMLSTQRVGTDTYELIFHLKGLVEQTLYDDDGIDGLFRDLLQDIEKSR